MAAALDPIDRAEIAHHLTLAGRDIAAAAAWTEAAAHARSVGALAEAADFLVRATGLAPLDGQLCSELAEVWAWLGKRTESESAWNQCLTLLAAEELPRAWCRRGRPFRTVICHPQASLRAYRHAETLLSAETDDATRAELLIGLAWGEAVAGTATGIEKLLAAADEWLPPSPPPETMADIAEILARLGRHPEAAAGAHRQQECAARLDAPELAATAAHDAGLVALAAGRYADPAALLGQGLEVGPS